MEWGKLFASLPDEPRVQAAEDDGGAFGLLAESMCYCTAAGSGGFIPDTQVRRFLCFKPTRVKALSRENLWQRDEAGRGFRLDPEIWNEERNLSDSAEKKRKADRERIAAKRAGERGDMSRDIPATGSATCSSGSRGLDQSREEEKDHPSSERPSLTLVADPDDDDLIQVVIKMIYTQAARIVSPADARSIAAEILSSAKGPVSDRRRYVEAAIAREPDPAARWLGPVSTPFQPPAEGRHAYEPGPNEVCKECELPKSNRNRHLEAS